MLDPGITNPMNVHFVCGNRKFKREFIYIYSLKVNDILIFVVLRIFVMTLMPWYDGEISVFILFGNLSISLASMYLDSI